MGTEWAGLNAPPWDHGTSACRSIALGDDWSAPQPQLSPSGPPASPPALRPPWANQAPPC